MRYVIRLDDPTDRGGKVVKIIRELVEVKGKHVARIGDLCVCPSLECPKTCVIIEGDPKVLLEGIPVAFHGHKITCGATLISTVDCAGTE